MNLTFHSCVQNFIVVHNKKIRRMVHHFNNLGTQQLINWFLASLASILMWPMIMEFLVLPLTHDAINELQKPFFYASQATFIFFYFLFLPTKPSNPILKAKDGKWLIEWHHISAVHTGTCIIICFKSLCPSLSRTLKKCMPRWNLFNMVTASIIKKSSYFVQAGAPAFVDTCFWNSNISFHVNVIVWRGQKVHPGVNKAVRIR